MIEWNSYVWLTKTFFFSNPTHYSTSKNRDWKFRFNIIPYGNYYRNYFWKKSRWKKTICGGKIDLGRNIWRNQIIQQVPFLWYSAPMSFRKDDNFDRSHTLLGWNFQNQIEHAYCQEIVLLSVIHSSSFILHHGAHWTKCTKNTCMIL